MIDLKEAVSAARKYLTQLYEGQRLDNLLLEEVELSEDNRYWFITFGFDTTQPLQLQASSNALSRPSPVFVRAFKLIKIDAETGEPISMKIREV